MNSKFIYPDSFGKVQNSKFKILNHSAFYILHFAFLVFIFSLFSLSTKAQQKPPVQPQPLTRILFLFDDSQSMMVKWQSNTKFEIAKKLLSEMVPGQLGSEVKARVMVH